jgi:hypothetical protein
MTAQNDAQAIELQLEKMRDKVVLVIVAVVVRIAG